MDPGIEFQEDRRFVPTVHIPKHRYFKITLSSDASKVGRSLH